MPPPTSTEEIIEKKATAPVATACLIISAVALLCAIALQVTEIAEYRSGLASTSPNPGADQAKKDVNKYKEEIGDILSKAPKTEGEAGTKAGAAAAEESDAAEDADAAETKTEPEASETKDQSKAGAPETEESTEDSSETEEEPAAE